MLLFDVTRFLFGDKTNSDYACGGIVLFSGTGTSGLAGVGGTAGLFGSLGTTDGAPSSAGTMITSEEECCTAAPLWISVDEQS